MFLRNKKYKDKLEADRQRVITYKKVFGTPDGKEILFDLLNKYHVLNPHDGSLLKEGQRQVALYILSQCSIDLVQFEKLLRGDFNE